MFNNFHERLIRLVHGFDEILNADDSLLAHEFLDHDIVSDGRFGTVLCSQETSLSDEVSHRLLGRNAPGQEVLHQRQLLGEVGSGFQEHHVVDLFQSQRSQDLLGLGRRVLRLVNAHGDNELVLGRDVERFNSLVAVFLM